MMRASCLPLVVAFVVVPVLGAGAQNLPWPNNPPPSAGATAAVTPAPMAPAQMSPAPMSPAMSPMMGAPMSPPGPGMGGGEGGSPPACVVEFSKMREDVQKKGAAAKQASDRKVTREELCKLVSAYSGAEQKWLKFAETGVSSCGIPPEIVKQLQQVHARTDQARERICAAGPANAQMAAPSLADALGTTRPPTETKRTGANTFDTLTGNVMK
jgi:hypothetical protein